LVRVELQDPQVFGQRVLGGLGVELAPARQLQVADLRVTLAPTSLVDAPSRGLSATTATSAFSARRTLRT